MSRTRWARFGLAAACVAMLTAPVVASAQVVYQMPQVDMYGSIVPSPGDESTPAEAYRNNIESRRYEALLRANPAFRARREAMECGSIADPEARANCIATFEGPGPDR